MMMIFPISKAEKEEKAYDDGLPAQLHMEYSPSPTRKAAYERVSKNNSLKYHGEAVADIVLVHGLASKYETTWAYKRKDGSRYHWIRQRLPEDVPDCRILGFEYPSRWYDDPVHTDLTECAFELLRCLIRSRCHRGKQTMCNTRRKRPIILIGHSFGGLVIKKMMVLASLVLSSNSSLEEFENHRDLLSAIAGVVFLGTPHRGSSFALLAGLKIGFGKYVMKVSSNDEIIQILKESYVLDDLQDQFSTLCGDKRVSGLKLFCYYEMKEVPVLKKLVVTKDASCLDNAASRGMLANHMDMNTFPEGSDFNYDHFIADVLMLCQESTKTVPKRFDGWRYGSKFPDADREQLQSSLAPSHDQPTFYKTNLEKHIMAPYTCGWIHEVQEFKSWRSGSDETNVLWISGKAGSGKSVLTSYIIHSLLSQDESDRGATSCCFEPIGKPSCRFDSGHSPVLYFICGVDRAQEKPDRMLATFIHQLLLQCSENEEMIQKALELYENKLDGVSASEMAIMLQELLIFLSSTGQVYIIVDGLEEIAEPGKLIEALAVLRASTNARFLFVSQDDRIVGNALDRHFDIQQPLMITDHSSADIALFIEEKCADLMQKQPQLKEKEEFLAKYMETESRGMFQWVNAVFEDMAYVKEPKEIEKKLDGTGKDLIGTYDKVFERFGARDDAEWESRIRTALQFLAVSATSVSPAALKFACDMKQMPEDALSLLLNPGDERIIAEEEMAERHVRDLLGSAVDITYDGKKVRLQHGSMLKALTRVDTTSNNNSTAAAAKFKFTLEEAHFEIALICMRVCRGTTLFHANSFTPSRPPLVEYAWSYWGYHLNKSGMTFLTSTEKEQIIKLVALHPNLKVPVAQQQKLQDAFDRMIEGVSRDALLYLEALVDSLCRPLKAVPGHFSDREYVLSLQRAQESLIEPTRDICALRRMGPPSFKLHDTRKQVEDILAKNVNDAATALDRIQDAAEAVSEKTSQFLGSGASAIKRLHLDTYLKEHPNLPRPAQSAKLLLEIARNLRLVAVRFAVDPIYSSLLISAGGSTFSPLHPLIYVAQLLEESGRYPYWGKHPPATDLMDYFAFCPSDDSEHSAAQFVLHCFEWRDLDVQYGRNQSTEILTAEAGRYVRTSDQKLSLTTRPCPSGHQFTRVPTENWEQVRRLHQMSAERFWFARATYSVFGSDNEFIRDCVTKPLSHLHMNYSLGIDEFHSVPSSDVEIETVLDQYAPTEVREKPLETYLRSLPLQMRTMLVKYLMYILQFWGGLARQAMAIHYTRLEIAVGELNQVRDFCRRVNWLNRPVDPAAHVPAPGAAPAAEGAAGVPCRLPPVSRKHILYGFLIFLFRCMYFPSWGAYVWFHSWSNMSIAWKHPATYVDLQNDLGFWSLFWATLWTSIRYSIYTAASNWAITASSFPITIEGEPNTPDVEIMGHVVYAYSAFHHFCAIDRSLFSIANFLATIYACSTMMFYDANIFADMLRSSLFFWFNVLLGTISSAMHLGVQQKGGGWKGLLATMAAQFVLFYFALRYSVKIISGVILLLTPVTATVLFLWRNAMFASVVAAKTTGFICLLLLTLKCVQYTHKFVWDPYDCEESLKRLLKASEMVKSTLTIEDKRQLKRIGWYPLGEKPVQPSTNVIAEAWAETGPAHVVPTLVAATNQLDANFNEGMGDAMRGIKQFFDDGTWTRHMAQIGTYIDNTVLGISPPPAPLVSTSGTAARVGGTDGSLPASIDNALSGVVSQVGRVLDTYATNSINEARARSAWAQENPSSSGPSLFSAGRIDPVMETPNYFQISLANRVRGLALLLPGEGVIREPLTRKRSHTIVILARA